jgi:hypothetical protein
MTLISRETREIDYQIHAGPLYSIAAVPFAPPASPPILKNGGTFCGFVRRAIERIGGREMYTRIWGFLPIAQKGSFQMLAEAKPRILYLALSPVKIRENGSKSGAKVWSKT